MNNELGNRKSELSSALSYENYIVSKTMYILDMKLHRLVQREREREVLTENAVSDVFEVLSLHFGVLNIQAVAYMKHWDNAS